jgi:hypothetical protein
MRLAREDQVRYPKLTYCVKNELPTVVNVPRIANSIAKWGEIKKKDLGGLLTFGLDPMIKVANLKGAVGEFTPNKKSKEIRIDQGMVEKFEKSKPPGNSDIILLAGGTTLHELRHWGDGHDGVDIVRPAPLSHGSRRRAGGVAAGATTGFGCVGRSRSSRPAQGPHCRGCGFPGSVRMRALGSFSRADWNPRLTNSPRSNRNPCCFEMAAVRFDKSSRVTLSARGRAMRIWFPAPSTRMMHNSLNTSWYVLTMASYCRFVPRPQTFPAARPRGVNARRTDRKNSTVARC